jgi:hypothetical protein
MQSAFESWIGQYVLVRLTLGKSNVSLRGVLLKDRMETLLMGPEFGSELEIPKKIILAIEEVGVARLPVMLASFGSAAHSKNTSSRRDTVWTTAFKSHRLVRMQKTPHAEGVLDGEGRKTVGTSTVDESREVLASQSFARMLGRAGIASVRDPALRYGRWTRKLAPPKLKKEDLRLTFCVGT